MTEKIAPKIHSKQKKVLFHAAIYLAFCIFLLLLEGSWRLATPHIPSIKYFVTGKTHGDDSDGAVTFEGDALLGWRLKANLKQHWWDFTTFSTNSSHLHHPREIKEKTPGMIRIICLGDSVTFGYRVPETFREHPIPFDKNALPYPRLLEKRLRERRPKQEIEVVTLAVPGYSSHQGLSWLRRDIDEYDPDLVITSFGWNDTDIRTLADKVTLPNQWHKVLLRRLISWSQIGIYLARWSGSSKRKGVTDRRVDWLPRVSTKDYIANMMAIATLARENAAQVLVVGQVYQNAVTNQRQAKIIARNRKLLAAACKERQIPYLEIEELTERGYPDNQRLFGELIHPNYLGHRIMADRLLEIIEQQKLLRPLGKVIQ